jgi:dienelactone hydrolase
MTTQVTIPALFGGSFNGYLAAPRTQPRAGIVLIQEVLGVNKNMRQTADDFAKAGYVVIVPDLYWRLEPNVQLDPEDKNQWARSRGQFRLSQRSRRISGRSHAGVLETAFRVAELKSHIPQIFRQI